jgi:hypothetical protein
MPSKCEEEGVKGKKVRTISEDAGGKCVSEKSMSTGGKFVSENSTQLANLVQRAQLTTPSSLMK